MNPNAISFVPSIQHANTNHLDMVSPCSQFPIQNLELETRQIDLAPNANVCVLATTLRENLENEHMPKSPITSISNSQWTHNRSDSSGIDNTTCSINQLSPCVRNISTSAVSNSMGEVNPNTDFCVFSNVSVTGSIDNISNETIPSTIDNAFVSLKDIIRKQYVNNVLIGHLNINTLANKFDALKLIIEDRLHILVLVETKLDDSFPEEQFIIEGYTKPYMFDKNISGGGVLIYVRMDIPSKQLKKHKFSKNVEALFLEINLRKCWFLLAGIYHSKHPIYGTNDVDFFEQIGFALDVYSNYDTFLLVGDFNVQMGESAMGDFLHEFGAKSLIKDFTCFKSTSNPSCIDLFLTNSSNSFQCTKTISTGLSDFHQMIVTVLKTTFPKLKPKVLLYRK